MQRLKKRQDFLHVRDGRKAHAATLTLQARPAPGATEEARAGFTATKKTGGAVEHNRIRRRLREAVRRIGALHARPGHDYVLIGRTAALNAPFGAILDDLSQAFARVHADGSRASRRSGRPADEASR